ncbi:hypothetical protein PAPYR_10754 [Paratrimastix pyriformis]|uniref:Uncharacterized protein n=1 Tax=Paratrimastix pyriformis TaxID=342808 RepID=A0ABQ8U598_9EUKA|nr:hypothetical protein PAPYR_10754 [Paratrimastix pyriformis]
MGSYHRPSSNSLKDQNPQQPPFRGSLLCIIACVYLLPWDRDTVADAIFALVESIGFYSTVSHLLRMPTSSFGVFFQSPSPRAVCSPRDHLALIPVCGTPAPCSETTGTHLPLPLWKNVWHAPDETSVEIGTASFPFWGPLPGCPNPCRPVRAEGAGCWSLLTGTRWLAAVGCCDTKCMCIRGDGGRGNFIQKDGSVARKTLVPK